MPDQVVRIQLVSGGQLLKFGFSDRALFFAVFGVIPLHVLRSSPSESKITTTYSKSGAISLTPYSGTYPYTLDTLLLQPPISGVFPASKRLSGNTSNFWARKYFSENRGRGLLRIPHLEIPPYPRYQEPLLSAVCEVYGTIHKRTPAAFKYPPSCLFHGALASNYWPNSVLREMLL